ncbi:hypothetical protein B0T09DRAFT_180776 [Sordaria sp. MPI-SDFR-AT-0083]|nr:hypothetical protein B0T09DRAFT_180776 [Sordaria sp. MPI-SDFR-AT-0083]
MHSASVMYAAQKRAMGSLWHLKRQSKEFSASSTHTPTSYKPRSVRQIGEISRLEIQTERSMYLIMPSHAKEGGNGAVRCFQIRGGSTSRRKSRADQVSWSMAIHEHMSATDGLKGTWLVRPSGYGLIGYWVDGSTSLTLSALTPERKGNDHGFCFAKLCVCVCVCSGWFISGPSRTFTPPVSALRSLQKRGELRSDCGRMQPCAHL